MRIALLIMLCALFAAQAETQHPAQVAGVYEGSIPVKGSDARKLTLDLKQDGTAEFRDAAVRKTGQWSVEKQQLEVSLTAAAPMQWKVKGNLLTPQGWDKAVYGKKGPVLRRPR